VAARFFVGALLTNFLAVAMAFFFAVRNTTMPLLVEANVSIHADKKSA
jgi:hypothetical protein